MWGIVFACLQFDVCLVFFGVQKNVFFVPDQTLIGQEHR